MLTRPSSNQGSGNNVRVITRAAQILRVLKSDDRGLSLGEIAERIGLPRSTVQRLVNALIAEGFVVASASGSGLRLGLEIQSKLSIWRYFAPTLCCSSIRYKARTDCARSLPSARLFR